MKSTSSYKNLSNLTKQHQNSRLIYSDAVQMTSDRNLRTYLINRSQDWDRYVDQLGELMASEKTAKTSTLAGNLKSTWFTLQGDILGMHESKILDTLIQRENVMLTEYGKVCQDETLPVEVRSVLATQVASISAAQRNLRNWTLEE